MPNGNITSTAQVSGQMMTKIAEMTALEVNIHQALINDGHTFSIEENPIIMRKVPLDDVVQSVMNAIKKQMGWW